MGTSAVFSHQRKVTTLKTNSAIHKVTNNFGHFTNKICTHPQDQRYTYFFQPNIYIPFGDFPPRHLVLKYLMYSSKDFWSVGVMGSKLNTLPPLILRAASRRAQAAGEVAEFFSPNI